MASSPAADAIIRGTKRHFIEQAVIRAFILAWDGFNALDIEHGDVIETRHSEDMDEAWNIFQYLFRREKKADVMCSFWDIYDQRYRNGPENGEDSYVSVERTLLQ